LLAGVEGASRSFRGEWHLDNQELILNSYERPLVSEEKGKCDSLRIKVIHEEGDPAIWVGIVLKSEGNVMYGAETNFDGKAIIKINNADSLFISYIGCHSMIFPIDSNICFQTYRLYSTERIIVKDLVFIIQDNAICPKLNYPNQSGCLVRDQ